MGVGGKKKEKRNIAPLGMEGLVEISQWSLQRRFLPVWRLEWERSQARGRKRRKRMGHQTYTESGTD
jgi:hypothetical protein